jgi:hypothetical protein
VAAPRRLRQASSARCWRLLAPAEGWATGGISPFNEIFARLNACLRPNERTLRLHALKAHNCTRRPLAAIRFSCRADAGLKLSVPEDGQHEQLSLPLSPFLSLPSSFPRSELVLVKGGPQVRSGFAHCFHLLQIVLPFIHDRHPAVVAHILQAPAPAPSIQQRCSLLSVQPLQFTAEHSSGG